METAKLWAEMCKRSAGREMKRDSPVQNVQQAIDRCRSISKKFPACTYAEGRQTLRRIIHITNEFLATAYFVQFYVIDISIEIIYILAFKF